MSGLNRSEHYDEEFDLEEGSKFSQKLGGNTSDQMESARVASVTAAYQRMLNASANSSGISEIHEEPDPDDSGFHTLEESNQMNPAVEEGSDGDSFNEVHLKPYQEPDPDDHSVKNWESEPDPDDSQGEKNWESEQPLVESETTQPAAVVNRKLDAISPCEEPDPDDLEASLKHCVVAEHMPLHSEEMSILDSKTQAQKHFDEPDPDDLDEIMLAEPDPDDKLVHPVEISRMQIDEPDPDDEELQRIQDPVTVACGRLQKAIETLQADIYPALATVVFQTLFKIIR